LRTEGHASALLSRALHRRRLLELAALGRELQAGVIVTDLAQGSNGALGAIVCARRDFLLASATAGMNVELMWQCPRCAAHGSGACPASWGGYLARCPQRRWTGRSQLLRAEVQSLVHAPFPCASKATCASSRRRRLLLNFKLRILTAVLDGVASQSSTSSTRN